MVKQTKLIKFMIFVLLLIPVILFFSGLITSFVLNAKETRFTQVQHELEEAKKEEQKQNDIYDYKSSDEFKDEQYKHDQDNSYGNEGDVIINVQ